MAGESTSDDLMRTSNAGVQSDGACKQGMQQSTPVVLLVLCKGMLFRRLLLRYTRHALRDFILASEDYTRRALRDFVLASEAANGICELLSSRIPYHCDWNFIRVRCKFRVCKPLVTARTHPAFTGKRKRPKSLEKEGIWVPANLKNVINNYADREIVSVNVRKILFFRFLDWGKQISLRKDEVNGARMGLRHPIERVFNSEPWAGSTKVHMYMCEFENTLGLLMTVSRAISPLAA